jgi:hypothetical protein
LGGKIDNIYDCLEAISIELELASGGRRTTAFVPAS